MQFPAIHLQYLLPCSYKVMIYFVNLSTVRGNGFSAVPVTSPEAAHPFLNTPFFLSEIDHTSMERSLHKARRPFPQVR